jgi:hypothetical protein
MRALARAGARMGARARVGLLPGGLEAGWAWCQGALVSGIGSFWVGWIWEAMEVRFCG